MTGFPPYTKLNQVWRTLVVVNVVNDDFWLRTHEKIGTIGHECCGINYYNPEKELCGFNYFVEYVVIKKSSFYFFFYFFYFLFFIFFCRLLIGLSSTKIERRTDKLCGVKAYDPDTQGCCGWKPYDMSTTDCCSHYYPNTAPKGTCCKVYPNSGTSGYSCCRKKAYDAATQTCQKRKVENKNTTTPNKCVARTNSIQYKTGVVAAGNSTSTLLIKAVAMKFRLTYQVRTHSTLK